MAEDKKDKKEKKSGHDEGGGGSNLFVDAIFWVLLVLVAFSVIKGAFSAVGISFDALPSATAIFATIFDTVQVFSVFISLLFVIGIIYYNFKLDELHHAHDHGSADGHSEGTQDTSEVHKIAKPHGSHSHAPDKRWQNIETRMASHNESDWRLAIIECDIILEEMLTRMGYHGEGIGEKLKTVERSDFETIDEAWEAHKVRNRIAHDGPAYHLSHDEAKRVVGLFQKVFEEFYFL